MPAAILVRNLLKQYGGLVAASDVSFEVGEAEIFGLLGPNGAGKTTVVECILGLRQPDGGTIEIRGIDARAYPEQVKQRLGAQLQATSLADKITAREAIGLFGSFYSRRAPLRGLIDRFALADFADAAFDTLSAGQRQRLALALAFVNDPNVVFLDEPTAGLDPQSRRELHDSIRQMRKDGHTVLLTTHYLEEAQALCDRVAIIDHGQIIATGSPAELTANAQAVPRILLKTARPVAESWLKSLPGVRETRPISDGWEIATSQVNRTISALVPGLEGQGNELAGLQIVTPSLEDLFLELTARPPAPGA